MGQEGIVYMAGMTCMPDVRGIDLVRTGERVRLLLHHRMSRTAGVELSGIHQKGRSVRKNVERALSSSGVDGMDVKISLLPSRKLFSRDRMIRSVAAGAEKPQQQHQHDTCFMESICFPDHSRHSRLVL